MTRIYDPSKSRVSVPAFSLTPRFTNSRTGQHYEPGAYFVGKPGGDTKESRRAFKRHLRENSVVNPANVKIRNEPPLAVEPPVSSPAQKKAGAKSGQVVAPPLPNETGGPQKKTIAPGALAALIAVGDALGLPTPGEAKAAGLDPREVAEKAKAHLAGKEIVGDDGQIIPVFEDFGNRVAQEAAKNGYVQSGPFAGGGGSTTVINKGEGGLNPIVTLLLAGGMFLL